ncbi:MAG: RIP metalloprotease RseP [Rickettsiales bacterium]|nr:RIP metalloprotease RseP [Rickettsiales bacterium]
MEAIGDLTHTILSFVFVLSVIVFIHEFGHYIIARWCGVKIEVFSIGFGKEIFGFNDKAGTRWKFSLLPLGGYVKMFGDQGAASTPDGKALKKMTKKQKAVSFHFKPLWKKALIVAGGPLFNFLTTIAVFTWFAFNNGITSTEPFIGEVIKESAAQEAGLRKGDRFLSINGEKIEVFHDIPMQIMTNLGTKINAEIQRGEKTLTFSIIPRVIKTTDAFGNEVEQPLIGIRSQKITFKDVGVVQAVKHSVTRTWDICGATLQVLGQLITGQRGTEQLKGPIGIAQMSGQATDAGVSTVLWFIALLSANLGLVNLLPIPMLDGGHLLYYTVEAANGKPMAQKFQEYGYKLGLVTLVSLMAFTIVNDIVQLL